MEKARIVFVSNYINHHQIPLCNQLVELTQGSFAFIQTQPMEQERLAMGWNQDSLPEYVVLEQENPKLTKQLINQAQVVLFGGIQDDSYIAERLEEKKPIVRMDERMYKEGQWKMVSPRGLHRKYFQHIKYRKNPVYFLCAGAYVADDMRLIHAYPGKKFCWGYFPETIAYDIDNLMRQKESKPYIVWAGRFIDWKHPELALYTSHYLKSKGYDFQLVMIGGGEMEQQLKELCQKMGLSDFVDFVGYQRPEAVRQFMEKANIFLFTSDRKEGWGAVANEAMNSGMAIVASHMIGAAPFLIRHRKNGLIYRDGCKQMLFEQVESLVADAAWREKLGREAYHTILTTWNAEHAAKELVTLLHEVVIPNKKVFASWGDPFGPCLPAPEIPERKMYAYLTKRKA